MLSSHSVPQLMSSPHVEQKICNLLQDCNFKQLKQIHGFIITNSLTRTIEISSRFLRRTTEFGRMDYSELVFSSIRAKCHPEIFLWNNMLRGYAHNGPSEKCIHLFDKMPERGLEPNGYTYPYVLKACLDLGNERDGKKIHCRILKTGFGSVSSVCNSVFDFYMKIGSFGNFGELGHARIGKLDDAMKVLNEMTVKPVELWNRMVSGCVDIGEVRYARRLFDEMPERDSVSWNSMISGYAKVGDVKNAEDLFRQMPEKNVVSWTTMIGVFANSGDFKAARRIFDVMPERNVVSWNCMISKYAQHEKFKEALDLFVQMQLEGVVSDGFTLVSALSACAHLGALEFGKWIHFHLIRDELHLGEIVGTALIEMYAKCGDIDKALVLFIKMFKKDVFCWNVMIKSAAIHGRFKVAIDLFSTMLNNGFIPNDFTFTSALFACNHGGLVDEGGKIFDSMKRDFGIDPKIEHYGCLIDLLGRNGRLEEAHLLAREMPFEPDIAVWGALLGGCRVRRDTELAERVMEKIVELRSNESGVYVLLSNIYALASQWPEAQRAREKMEDGRIWKKAGWSSVLEADSGS
ncbi:hypothetical protein AAC387_Pa11g0341 [Persea americana]